LRDGLHEGGLAGDAVETVMPETEAVAHALRTMAGGDLVVVLADDVGAVLAQVRRAADLAHGAHGAGAAR